MLSCFFFFFLGQKAWKGTCWLSRWNLLGIQTNLTVQETLLKTLMSEIFDTHMQMCLVGQDGQTELPMAFFETVFCLCTDGFTWNGHATGNLNSDLGLDDSANSAQELTTFFVRIFGKMKGWWQMTWVLADMFIAAFPSIKKMQGKAAVFKMLLGHHFSIFFNKMWQFSIWQWTISFQGSGRSRTTNGQAPPKFNSWTMRVGPDIPCFGCVIGKTQMSFEFWFFSSSGTVAFQRKQAIQVSIRAASAHFCLTIHPLPCHGTGSLQMLCLEARRQHIENELLALATGLFLFQKLHGYPTKNHCRINMQNIVDKGQL